MTVLRHAFLVKMALPPGMTRLQCRDQLRELIENAVRNGGVKPDVSVQRFSEADEHAPPAPQSTQSER